MGQIAAFYRLMRAGFILVRHDALIPREAAAHAPPPARLAAATLRVLFAGGASKRGRPGERLAAAVQKIGPVAIKLGQLLSTRADIFGDQFVADLGHLKDALPPFPTARAKAEVEAGLGAPIADKFISFGEPVAAASLAQAHPAVLKDGRKVAVKVLRPGVERRVAEELQAMALGAAMFERLAPDLKRLEPRAFVATVERSMVIELDLRLEAAAASEMAEVMAATAWMSAPKVVWEGVSKRVLTLEWADGVPLSAPGALDQPGMDRPALAVALIRAFLSQALDHGVFHADLHEGNLFVAPPSKLVAVDFGIVGRLGRKEQAFLAEILWGFLKRDYRRIAEVHFEAGYVPPEHGVDDFAQALRAVGEPIFGRPADQVSMGRLLGQLLEITGLFDMHMRPELVLLQKTMVAVEGVARGIDPGSDIWTAAQPVVEAWIARELSPAAKAKQWVERAGKALDGLARLASAPPAPVPAVVVTPATDKRVWALVMLAVLLGAAALGLSLR